MEKKEPPKAFLQGLCDGCAFLHLNYSISHQTREFKFKKLVSVHYFGKSSADHPSCITVKICQYFFVLLKFFLKLTNISSGK